MHRPVHFELHSTDPERTSRFFAEVFGWKTSKWDGPMEYWLFQTGGGDGIDGGMLRSRDGQARTVNTIETEDVDEACARIERHGGQVVVPKMAIRGVGWIAFAMEPSGNLFGVMHADASAE